MVSKKLAEGQSSAVIIEKFASFLKEKRKRNTPERYKILDKVLEFSKQFTVEDLSRAMRDDAFLVSRSTLYYTVDLLVEAQILRKINSGGSSIAYERVDQVQYIHLKCEVCGKTKLVRDTAFMAYMNARKFAAFRTRYYNLTVYGTCNDCMRRLKRNRGNNK